MSSPVLSAASATETSAWPTTDRASFSTCRDTLEAPTSNESAVSARMLASLRSVASCVDTSMELGMSAITAPPACTCTSALERTRTSAPPISVVVSPDIVASSASEVMSKSSTVCSESSLPAIDTSLATASTF